MNKKVLRGLIALAIVFSGGLAITMSSNDVYACTKCSIKNSNRKCGGCGSSRLYVKKVWTASNGRQRTSWKCEDCPHGFTTELRKGKEVVLNGNE